MPLFPVCTMYEEIDEENHLYFKVPEVTGTMAQDIRALWLHRGPTEQIPWHVCNCTALHHHIPDREGSDAESSSAIYRSQPDL